MRPTVLDYPSTPMLAARIVMVVPDMWLGCEVVVGLSPPQPSLRVAAVTLPPHRCLNPTTAPSPSPLHPSLPSSIPISPLFFIVAATLSHSDPILRACKRAPSLSHRIGIHDASPSPPLRPPLLPSPARARAMARGKGKGKGKSSPEAGKPTRPTVLDYPSTPTPAARIVTVVPNVGLGCEVVVGPPPP
ncbi:hypothetical protein GUJ93_ZPchr0008g11381 [Zizania palustris]|uniref:Uncharacterized protein n=1 Tax=Zizania palustris TaxID=103762 RepID=A0A8J5RK29_ZIZPA|nr:hypothetical protein GUJ93_ZPchr0008g11381 [Zizania palustris]